MNDKYYYDICSRLVISFAIKCVGIIDDLNYKRWQKTGVDSDHKVLAIILIVVFVLPAWFLIAVAVAIAMIAEALTYKPSEDV